MRTEEGSASIVHPAGCIVPVVLLGVRVYAEPHC